MAYTPQAPGPQNPNNYPVSPGENYRRWGEQQGWVYDPYKDHYFPDPKAQQNLYEQQGRVQKQPKPQSLGGLLLPVAGAATIFKATDLGGKAIADKFKIGTGDVAKPELASDASTALTQNAPSAQAPQALAPQAPTTGSGMLAPEIGGQTSINGPQSTSTAGTMPNGQSAVSGGEVAGTTASAVPDEGFLGTGYSGAELAQGGLGLLQGYQGLKQLQKGNYVGGGLNLAGGVGNVAQAANYAGAGSQTLGSAMPFLNGALGVYNGIQTANMIGNAPSGGKRNSAGAIGGASSGAGLGAALGSVVPGLGTGIGAAVGGGIGLLTGLAGSVFGSSKGERQQYRDQVRGVLQKNNILDDKYQGTLADGSKYDFGGDGSKIKVDYKDPTTGKVIGLANVISAAEGNFGKGGEATAELYTSGAMSNSGGDYNKAKQNVLHFAQQRGFNRDNVMQQLQKMKDEKQITDAQYNANVAGANELFGSQQNQSRNRSKGTVQTGRGLLTR